MRDDRPRTSGRFVSLRSRQRTGTGRCGSSEPDPATPGCSPSRDSAPSKHADVIVADRLGARGVLDGLAADGVELTAEVVDVGKLPGHHAVPQDAINALLVQLARDGKTVVRLKGGDPYVFGRGGEELAACQEAGVEVEVVPGITSAISVPAIAGIPLTHRGVATSFTVVTGHDQIRDLGGGRDHTVVLLMGVGTLANSALMLARGDRGADCPVAIVEDGFGPRQRVTVGTLATIAQQAAARGVRSPAVVVVGDVVRLSPYAPAEIATLDLSTFDPLAPPRANNATGLAPKLRDLFDPLTTSASRSSAPAPPASMPATSSPTPLRRSAGPG